MHLKIWPQCAGSSLFGGSGHTCRVCMASVSGAQVWFISGRSDLLQCGSPGSTTLLATLGQADSPPLVQSTATTDGTHEDHPVMELNVVHGESLLLCDLLQNSHTRLEVGDTV